MRCLLVTDALDNGGRLRLDDSCTCCCFTPFNAMLSTLDDILLTVEHPVHGEPEGSGG